MDEIAGAAPLGRFLSVADTAELLSVTVEEAFALVRSGELPAIRVGANGPWRIERSVLEAFIDSQYEEVRRMSLFNQAEFADLPELFERQTRTTSN
jgi:excisionase family DNA binding protein